MDYLQQIQEFPAKTDQEQTEKKRILEYCRLFHDTILKRENSLVHMTASGLIFNENRKKVLMVHHNIYDTWTWTGGHADGERDLLKTALKEGCEETGVKKLSPISYDILALNILAVQGHRKNGKYVTAHLHISAAYGLWTEEEEQFASKPDENTGVKWFPVEELQSTCKEPHMLPIYDRVVKSVLQL